MTYTRSAAFSDDGNHRYMLEHHWTDHGGDRLVGFVLLNPSTADAYKDDPTIRRCVGFAKEWGYDGMLLANILTFRATDPKDLPREHDEAIGPHRDYFLRELAERCDIIVCAWGASAPHLVNRRIIHMTTKVLATGTSRDPLYCFGRTDHGKPKHPLYLRKDTDLEIYDAK